MGMMQYVEVLLKSFNIVALFFVYSFEKGFKFAANKIKSSSNAEGLLRCSNSLWIHLGMKCYSRVRIIEETQNIII